MSAGALAIGSISKGAETKKGCPIGFGTYGLPGYTPELAIQSIAKAGFDSIEIAAMPGYHGAPEVISHNQRKLLRRILNDSGLKLGALMGLPNPDQAKEKENLDWVKRILELAVDLAPGTPPIIQSVLGGGDWHAKKHLFCDTLGLWLSHSKESGIKLAIKPHRGHAMSRPQDAIWLIRQLNAKGKLGLVYDYSHYAFRDMKVGETIEASLPYIDYLVMKDAIQVDGQVQLPGESGNIPHARILKSFYEGGYRGEVCCEVSSQVWRREGYDAESALATCFSNLKEIYADAEVKSSS